LHKSEPHLYVPLVLINSVNAHDDKLQVGELQGNHEAGQEADALQMEIITNPKESLSNLYTVEGGTVVWNTAQSNPEQ
jgi:hypothetical protein